MVDALKTEKPTPAPDDTPSPTAKAVQITVNFPAPVTVQGMRFQGGPTMYKQGSLKWKEEDWSKAKSDPKIAIEEVDDSGKVFVSRRNSEGRVVAEGTESVPPRPRKRAARADEA